MKFTISLLLFMLTWFPVCVFGLPATFVLLLTKWDGKTTWFGNYLYGRQGNSHMPTNPNLFDQWWFLTIRNPISNFGKRVLSIRETAKWAWLEDKQVFGNFYWMYGWKNPVDGRRTFVYRPWLKK